MAINHVNSKAISLSCAHLPDKARPIAFFARDRPQQRMPFSPRRCRKRTPPAEASTLTLSIGPLQWPNAFHSHRDTQSASAGVATATARSIRSAAATARNEHHTRSNSSAPIGTRTIRNSYRRRKAALRPSERSAATQASGNRREVDVVGRGRASGRGPNVLDQAGQATADVLVAMTHKVKRAAEIEVKHLQRHQACLLYTSPSPRDRG